MYLYICKFLAALTIIGDDNVTVFESTGEVTVCAQVAGNTTGTDVNIPITFSPRVSPPSGSNKANSELMCFYYSHMLNLSLYLSHTHKHIYSHTQLMTLTKHHKQLY